jgi:crossover junction endodeoxyribonuclease RuvC
MDTPQSAGLACSSRTLASMDTPPLEALTTVRILGVDPGLANTGWGIVEARSGQRRAVAYGCINTTAGTDQAQRLRLIHDEISQVILRYQPSEMALENVYFGTNAKSALSIGEVRGAVILAAASRDLTVFDYSVTQIKQTIVGAGRADKAQIQFMVKALLKLDHQPQPDHSADALAVALCHAQLRKISAGQA